MTEPSKDQRIFHEAAALSGDEREAFLQRELGDAPERLARLRRQLDIDEAPDPTSPFIRPEPSSSARPAVSSKHAPGDKVGKYVLREEIGAGGFGRVWLAARPDMEKNVAIKFPIASVDHAPAPEHVRSFEQEQKNLGRLSHPGIAQVLDAGLDERGCPYIVMEYVPDPQPITAYCDGQGLPIEERLELFAEVCDAIDYANRKGIIHLDIKPDNILVTDRDSERPQVKIVDFGIAVEIDRFLPEESKYRRGLSVPYMSPEQANLKMSRSGFGKSDIYQLGFLLYELIVGKGPVTKAQWEKYFDGRVGDDRIKGIQAWFDECEPPRPAERLQQIAAEDPDEARKIPQRRQTSFKNLLTQLRGDLGWIPMMAMRREPRRRYERAGELGRDVRRYLDGFPVLAAPQSATYRIRKFVGRHKVGAVGAASLAFVVLAGFAISLWQWNVAERARADAEARVAQLEEVDDFLEVLLTGIDTHGLGRSLRADLLNAHREALFNLGRDESDKRNEALEREIAGVNLTDVAGNLFSSAVIERAAREIGPQDGVRIDENRENFQEHIGNLYAKLGRYDEARKQQERVWDSRERRLGESDPRTLRTSQVLGELYLELDEYDHAAGHLKRAWEGHRDVFGPEDPMSIQSESMYGFALFRQDPGDAEAKVRLESAYKIAADKLGRFHAVTVRSQHRVAMLKLSEGDHETAGDLLEQAIDRMSDRDDLQDLDDLQKFKLGLAGVRLKQNRLNDATKLADGVCDWRSKNLGDNHLGTAAARFERAKLLRELDRPPLDRIEADLFEAHRVYTAQQWSPKRRRIKVAKAFVDQLPRFEEAEHADGGARTDSAPVGSAATSWSEQRQSRIEGLFEDLLAHSGGEADDDEKRLETLSYRNEFGRWLRQNGRLDDAESQYLQALEGRREVLPEHDPDLLTSENNMGVLRFVQGNYAEAETYFRTAFDGRLAQDGEISPGTLNAAYYLRESILKQGRTLDESLEDDIFRIERAVLGETSETVLAKLKLRVEESLQADDLDAAARYQDRLRSSYKEKHGVGHPLTVQADLELGQVYRRLGRTNEAKACFERVLQHPNVFKDQDREQLFWTQNELGLIYRQEGRIDEADHLYQEAWEGRKAALGETHPDTLTSLNNLGILEYSRKEYEAAKAHFQNALDGRRKTLGERHPATLDSQTYLAFARLECREDLEEVEALLADVYEIRLDLYGPNDPKTREAGDHVDLVRRLRGHLPVTQG